MRENEMRMTPQQHAHHIVDLIQQAQHECRADLGRVDDPRAQALFETVAEVLGGTMKALNDYQRGTERAWQPAQQAPASERHTPTVSDLRVDVDAAEPPPPLTHEMPSETWSERDPRA